MKCLVIFLLVAVVAIQAMTFSESDIAAWTAFKAQHKRTFKSYYDEDFRMRVFVDNKHMIDEHNKKFERGSVSYKLGINKFADMQHEEFVKIYTSKINPESSTKKSVGSEFKMPKDSNVSESVNWLNKGALTPVKDQGQCGSCWAFSTTGALESQIFLKTGNLTSLSEQNLIDCSKDYGNEGCDGGLMTQAYEYIKKNHGIDSEKSYPYEANDYQKCRYKKANKNAEILDYVELPVGDEKKLKVAVATIGPISAGIDAGHESFQFYSGGIYEERKCSPKNLNHAILIVGYDTDKSGKDYWIVKNSWGKSWGDEGYFKLLRNKQNHCGIASLTSYPVV